MNILLTTVGRRTYLVEYFKDALEGAGKVFVSNSIYSIAMSKADGYFLTPLIYDENYIDSIIDYCKYNSIKVVISLFDIDLLVLSKNEKRFIENNIELILAPYNSVLICNDKWETYKNVISIGLNTPKTFLSVNEAIKEISMNLLTYPLIVKPRWGMASMSVYKVNTEEELIVLYKKCEEEISSTFLKYESGLASDGSVIIQEFIKGEEYGLDVINNLEARYINTFVKQKVTMRAGETDIGKTVSNSLFLGISISLSSLIKQRGILSVDCIKAENEIYVIELNCRISGHYPISHLAGIDYPRMLIRWLNNESDISDLEGFKEGLYVTKDLVPVMLNLQ